MIYVICCERASRRLEYAGLIDLISGKSRATARQSNWDYLIWGVAKSLDFFLRARKQRAENRSLHVVNEDSSRCAVATVLT